MNVKSQWQALQKFTAKLQEDFDHNLRLLDERDLELLERERELEELQRRHSETGDQTEILRQELVVAQQGMCSLPQKETQILALRKCSFPLYNLQMTYLLYLPNPLSL